MRGSRHVKLQECCINPAKRGENEQNPEIVRPRTCKRASHGAPRSTTRSEAFLTPTRLQIDWNDSHLHSRDERQKTAILHFTKVAPAVGDAIAEFGANASGGRKRDIQPKLRPPPHRCGNRKMPLFASGSLTTSSLTSCSRAALETYVCGQSKRCIALRTCALSLLNPPQ